LCLLCNPRPQPFARRTLQDVACAAPTPNPSVTSYLLHRFPLLRSDPPIADDPTLEEYNVNQRVQDFIDTAMAQANATQGTDLMWTQVRGQGCEHERRRGHVHEALCSRASGGNGLAGGCGGALGCDWHSLLLQVQMMKRRRRRWGCL
jgi:hypothetical protein